jgi:uncharacterized protein YcgI (DUF1989 family)
LTKYSSIRIIDVAGQQVADLVAFSSSDKSEKLSTGATIDCNGSISPRRGDRLFSNRYAAMLTIVEDRVEQHDLLHPPCSLPMYRVQHGIAGEHPNCLQNLTNALAPFGLGMEDLPGPFNIFMHSVISSDGRVQVEKPLSKPGDFIELRAEMDLIVAISACSVEESACNGFACTPIDIRFLGG